MSVSDAGTSRALGLSNELFVLGDSVVLTVLGQVAFMPVLVLAAKLCPEVRPYMIYHLQSSVSRDAPHWYVGPRYLQPLALKRAHG